MENHDHYYGLKGAVNNLIMLKLAFDYGLDMTNFTGYMNDYSYGIEHDWDIFYQTINSVFTIVEMWSQCGEQEDLAEKKYWAEQANFGDDDLDDWGILVLLDDRIDSSTLSSITSGGNNDFNMGFAEILPIEKGIVVAWNDNDGNPDLTDILMILFEFLPKREEYTQNAVAI